MNWNLRRRLRANRLAVAWNVLRGRPTLYRLVLTVPKGWIGVLDTELHHPERHPAVIDGAENRGLFGFQNVFRIDPQTNAPAILQGGRRP